MEGVPENPETGPGLSGSELAAMLSTGGATSRLLSGYEERPGQVQMLLAVVEAFRADGILLVEAGTGVGKSLAYGIPAANWAKVTGEKVVISSATINLQEQLVGKDLPLVGELLGGDLDAVLVKGRRNYLCKRRLGETGRQTTLLTQDTFGEYLRVITEWTDSTCDGSRADLPFSVPEDVWERVACDADACLGRRCPFRDDCFFVKARRAADNADILVVNHHLLFADLALRRILDDWSHRAVLPPFRRLILDEAHGLEDAASSFFGARMTRFGVSRILSRLLPSRSKGGGLLTSLAADVDTHGGALSAGRADRMEQQTSGFVAPLVSATRESYNRAFDLLQNMILGVSGSGLGDARVRLTPEIWGHEDWTAVREGFRLAGDGIRSLSVEVARVVDRLADLDENEGRMAEARSWIRRADALSKETEHLISEASDGSVRWVEVARKGKKRVTFQSAPLDVSTLMNETIYDQMSTVVLTSATLSVNGSFAFLQARAGLDLQPEPRVRTELVPSPFDFTRQVKLVLPTDLPPPNQPLFEQVLPEAVYQAALVSDGSALVLFTSWGLMTRVHEMTRDRLEERGLEVLCQGEQPRDKLLQRFRDNEQSILFGTDSFWQGVDVMGPSLRNVIITRLPFDVPDEPLVQARMEAVEREGKSSFAHFMVPRAVLKLKQGFGRLIRSRSDWGAVVVLDNRLLGRSYGQRFLNSLPPANLLRGSMEEVYDEMAGFFSEKGGSAAERVVILEHP